MQCRNCGKVLNQGEKFCNNCGEKVENETSFAFENDSNQINSNINNIAKSDNKRDISKIIGIISLVLVFIFQIFTIPLSIVGLVFGIKSFKQDRNNKTGMILNIISLGLVIPIFILYSKIFANPVVGTWNCKKFTNGSYENAEYLVTFELEKSNKFRWSKYSDGKNNYVIGKYEYADLHKTNDDRTANYYSITLKGDEFVNNGVLQTEPYNAKYEMGIIKNKNEAILMNTQTYNMYYCYKR